MATRFDDNCPFDNQHFSREDNRPNYNADDNNPRDDRHF